MSSEGYCGPRAAWHTLVVALPALGCFALVLLTTAAWQHFRPVGFTRAFGRLEEAIILAQRERAVTIPAEVDVLIVGDSAGMMGIDATRLTELLGGARVESLATIGLVPPEGNAAILRRFSERPGRARRLLITLHPSSLKRLNQSPFGPLWTRTAIHGARPRIPPADFFSGIRARLVSSVDPVLYLPMNGPLGEYYGTPESFAEFLRDHHGTAIDPRNLEPERLLFAVANRKSCFVEKAKLSALAPLAREIARLDTDRALFVQMPAIAGSDPIEAERVCQETSRQVRRALGLDPTQSLALPSLLSRDLFANVTHLNRKGRRHFTRLLASALLRDE